MADIADDRVGGGEQERADTPGRASSSRLAVAATFASYVPTGSATERSTEVLAAR
jgi:hypothetical protein